MRMESEIKRKTATTLITRLGSVSDQVRVAALCELRLLTKTDPEIRSIIASLDDAAAVSYLAETLYSTSHLSQENAAATLLNVSISCKEPLMSTRGLLDAISYALSHHKSSTHPSAVQSCAATLYSLLMVEEYRAVIGSKKDVLYSLVEIVRWEESASRSVKDAVKCLFALSLFRLNRESLIGFGAVGALFGLVGDGRRGVGLVEDATAVVAQLAGCEEGPGAVRRVGGVRVLVELIGGGGGSRRVKENAVSALLNLVEFGGEEVGEEIREVGLGLVFDGLGEVIESGSEKGRKRGQALMKFLDGGMSFKKCSSDEDSCSDFRSGPLMDSSHSY